MKDAIYKKRRVREEIYREVLRIRIDVDVLLVFMAIFRAGAYEGPELC